LEFARQRQRHPGVRAFVDRNDVMQYGQTSRPRAANLEKALKTPKLGKKEESAARGRIRRSSKRRLCARPRFDRGTAPARLQALFLPFECIGKGKASAPYEFGVKASIDATNGRAVGGLFVLHATRLRRNEGI
jgi:hypothetical protein